MTARSAGAEPGEDSGSVRRGGHCAAGRHYDCSGHLGCDCECHAEPTHYTADGAPLAQQARELVIENRRLREQVARARALADDYDGPDERWAEYSTTWIARSIRRALDGPETDNRNEETDHAR